MDDGTVVAGRAREGPLTLTAAPPRALAPGGRRGLPPAPRAAVLAVALAVVLGAALRVRRWAEGRSLHLDEAMLLDGLLDRPFADLAGTLPDTQSGPLGWLVLERALLEVSTHEQVLRAPSLVAGVATVVLVAAAAWRLLGPWPAAAAAGLVAVDPQLLERADEVKPYALDGAVAAAALLAGALVVTRGRPRATGLVGLALAGTVACWFSSPAPFALAGLGAALLVVALRSRGERTRPVLAVLGVGVVWLASAAAHALVVLPDDGSLERFRSYWAFALGDRADRSSASYLSDRSADLLGDVAWLRPWPLAAAVVVLGVALLVRRAPGAAALLAVPPVALLGAGLLGVWPPTGRLGVVVAPALLVAAAVPLAAALRLSPRRSPRARVVAVVAGAGVLAVLSAPAAARTAADAVDVPTTPGARVAVTALLERVEAGDVVLVDGWARPAGVWYLSTLPGAEDVARQVAALVEPLREDAEVGCETSAEPLRAALAGGASVWVVVDHRPSTEDRPRAETLADAAAGLGGVDVVARAEGGAALLHVTAGPGARPPDERPCLRLVTRPPALPPAAGGAVARVAGAATP